MIHFNIKQFLKSFNILTDSEVDYFISQTVNQSLNKGDYFIKEGETCMQVSFVLSGILRSYRTTNKGEEITYCLTFPNVFVTAYSSFITENKTQENIQAIDNVELITIEKRKLENLASTHVNWMKFLKVVAEQQYIELENRIFELQKNNALARYQNLMKNHPEYVLKVSLGHLASYLGISQRHMSRIRKEITY